MLPQRYIENEVEKRKRLAALALNAPLTSRDMDVTATARMVPALDTPARVQPTRVDMGDAPALTTRVDTSQPGWSVMANPPMASAPVTAMPVRPGIDPAPMAPSLDLSAPVPDPYRGPVFMGTKTAGMSPTDIAAARLATLESADPNSDVRTTSQGIEVLAPHRMSRFKALLAGLGRGAAMGAGGGLGGIIGGAAAVGLTGVISPTAIARVNRQGAIAEANREYDTALTRDSAQALNAQRTASAADTAALAHERLTPKRPGFSLGLHHFEYDPVTGKPVEVASVPDKPKSATDGFTLPPGGARYDVNGKLIVERPSDKPETPNTAPALSQQIQETQSQIDADQKEWETHDSNLGRKDALWKSQAAKVHAEQVAAYAASPLVKPQTLKELYDEAQANDPDFSGDSGAYHYSTQRRQELADRLKENKTRLRSLQDDLVKANAKPTRPSASGFAVPANSQGRKWSKSAFASAHPGADVNAAAKAMSAAGSVVVD